MVVQLFTSVLLLVLPLIIHGKFATISVFNGSASLDLSAYPDDATLSDELTVKINLTSTTNDMHAVTDHIPEMQTLLPSISTSDSDITIKYDQSTLGVLDTSAVKTNIVTLGWPIDMDFHREYILVTISISFDNKYLTITNNVIDNRVKIGFLPLYHQCYPKEGCDLTIDISHFVDSQPFDVTVELSNSSGDSVFQDTFSTKEDDRRLEQITAPKVGSYRATLSVAIEFQNHVYWSNQYLEIQVVMNEVSSIKAELKELHSLYGKLLNKYNKLSNEFESLKNSTVLKECKNGMCPINSDCRVDAKGGHQCTCHEGFEGTNCDLSFLDPTLKDGEGLVYIERFLGLDGVSFLNSCAPIRFMPCAISTTTTSQPVSSNSSSAVDNSTTPTSQPVSSNTSSPVNNSTTTTSQPVSSNTSSAVDISTTTTGQPVSSNSSTPSLQSETPSSDPDDKSNTEQEHVESSYPNNTLLYGGFIVFIAFLVVCVIAYLAYHNKDKILKLFGGKKETIVEMAMRSRTKNKGYKKLPTSIHDTLTHED